MKAAPQTSRFDCQSNSKPLDDGTSCLTQTITSREYAKTRDSFIRAHQTRTPGTRHAASEATAADHAFQRLRWCRSSAAPGRCWGHILPRVFDGSDPSDCPIQRPSTNRHSGHHSATASNKGHLSQRHLQATDTTVTATMQSWPGTTPRTAGRPADGRHFNPSHIWPPPKATRLKMQ